MKMLPKFLLSAALVATMATSFSAVQAATPPDTLVQATAMFALGLLSNASVIPGLLKALEDRDAQVREKAALGLAFRRDARVVDALIAHYRQDEGWADVRPPFTPLPSAEAERAIKTLADQHGFRLDFAEAA